jgi:hypothetical protein
MLVASKPVGWPCICRLGAKSGLALYFVPGTALNMIFWRHLDGQIKFVHKAILPNQNISE